MSGKAPFLRTEPVRRRLSRIAAPAAWLRSLCHFAGLRIGRVNPIIRRTIMVQEIRERWLWMYRLLGTFSSGTSISIDKNTKATSAPAAVSITPAQKKSVTLSGCAVTFLELKP